MSTSAFSRLLDLPKESIFQRSAEEYAAEQHHLTLNTQERKVFLSPAPIHPFWIQIIVNEMLALRDSGNGGFIGIDDNPIIIVDSINYATGELNYKALNPKDRIEVIWATDAEVRSDEENSYSNVTDEYFKCSCCGAPGQRYRCFYCKHIPGEKEL